MALADRLVIVSLVALAARRALAWASVSVPLLLSRVHKSPLAHTQWRQSTDGGGPVAG